MNSDQLNKFKTIAESKTLTEAAEKLFISQSALSQTIKVLEDELGCPLFTREKKNIYLNANGERLLQYANNVTDVISQIDYAFHNEHTINIAGTNVSVAFMLMNYPKDELSNINIHSVKEQDMPRLLKKGALDIIACDNYYIKQYPHSGSLEKILLCRELLGLYLPPGHELYDKKSIRYQDLENIPLCIRTDFPSQRLWLENIQKITGYKFNFAFNMDRYTYEILRKDIPYPEIKMVTSIYSTKENPDPALLDGYRFVKIEGTYSSRFLYLWYFKQNEHKILPIIESLKKFYINNPRIKTGVAINE